MQYQSGNEQAVTMISGDLTSTNAKPVSPSDDSQVQRTEKRLSQSLGCDIGMYGVIFFVRIFSVLPNNYHGEHATRNLETGHALIALVFCCFGVFVAYRKYQKPIRVFAWLGMIMAIFTCVINIMMFFYVVLPYVTLNTSDDGKSVMLGYSLSLCSSIIFRIFACLLMVFITKFAFKLAKQIDVNKHATPQAI